MSTGRQGDCTVCETGRDGVGSVGNIVACNVGKVQGTA